jgi:hypothetical protein
MDVIRCPKTCTYPVRQQISICYRFSNNMYCWQRRRYTSQRWINVYCISWFSLWAGVSFRVSSFCIRLKFDNKKKMSFLLDLICQMTMYFQLKTENPNEKSHWLYVHLSVCLAKRALSRLQKHLHPKRLLIPSLCACRIDITRYCWHSGRP